MTSRLKTGLAIATLTLALPAMAAGPAHFKGEPAHTLEQAMTNLATYNDRLAQVLAGDLTPEALHQVHQLTYTLENALERLDDEIDDIAERLEAVHQASEHAAPDTVKEQGAQYLSKSRPLTD